jgi:hypothetical protein
LVLLALSWAAVAGAQTNYSTQGDCSPIITDVQGKVIFECGSVPQDCKPPFDVPGDEHTLVKPLKNGESQTIQCASGGSVRVTCSAGTYISGQCGPASK